MRSKIPELPLFDSTWQTWFLWSVNKLARAITKSISRMCKKQTSVSHNSTEAETISLDAGLRMNGIPALDLWNLVIEVISLRPEPTQ